MKALGLSALSGVGLGWFGGCINVRRHLVEGRAQGKAKVLIPKADVARLKTPSDVMELRAKGLDMPILLRRLSDGKIYALSSECTHRSCELESTPHAYECPCHGSRFDLHGKVLAGPASQPLEQFSIAATPQGLLLTIGKA